MKQLLILTLGAALLTSACGTSASDTGAALGDTTAAAPAAASTAASRGAAASVKRAVAVSREVIIPAGTSLPLTLTSSLASDTSAVEDTVSAELTRSITINGRDVVPAGSRLTGRVTRVDGAGRVKGRAAISFRFTSLRTGGEQYEVQSAPLSRRAAATKGKDATKIAIGAGAGAALGAIFGGKKGALEGGAIGGGAGTGVVLATKGKEVRLAQGDDVTTRLTAPVTVRLGAGE